MNIAQFVPSPTHEEVASLLRQYICTGEVEIGSRLPTQRELAESMGVSRHSIRVALRVLEEQGLVETRLGVSGGSFVSKPHLEPRGIRLWVRKYLCDLDEIIDFRMAIEQQAVYLTAKRRTKDDLRAMWHSIQELPAEGGSLDTFRSADGRFHTAIGRAARNTRLEEASRKVRSDLFIPADTLDFKREIQKTRQHHSLIFEAIESRDADGAASRMGEHIEETRKAINRLLSGTG
ncbi:MAG: FCD domain-containing protein [Actinobacteria bacterium]|uniref:Unannotated protein n=1 Tax=freshwater metagenome TaxID=449393 RepID=A0A6J7MEJ6_9ZZZZ|nr:FCD domain-containing protein [Actinomycetota bacterium]